MNGGVNGMMEEPMELSFTDPSENTQIHKLASDDDHKVNKLNSSNQETIDHEDDIESMHKPNFIAENTNSNGVVDHESELPVTSTVPIQENVNNVCNDHNSNSNETCLIPLNSQEESEIKQELNKVSEQSEDTQELNKVSEQSRDTQELNNISEQSEIKQELKELIDDDMSKVDLTKDAVERINSTNGMSDESESSDEVFCLQKAEETVSINSESDIDGQDESSQEDDEKDESKSKSKVLSIINEWSENSNGNFVNCSSPDIQEIVSDNEDCVIEEEPKPQETKVPLRRSSRAIKRKRYIDDLENGDEQSDIEEITMSDLRSRPKPIVINDTKTLVEMAAKQMRSGIQKRDPTVVILDTNGESSGKVGQMRKNSMLVHNSQLNAQNLYQSILARGTTVTPLSNKNTTSSNSQSSCNSQPSILPSLTDDMFVVEAPSFIVPYVYEKPSFKPFREFVDKLGSEIAAQRAKEEEEQREKDKAEKVRRDMDKNEKRERGEEVEESEEENNKVDKIVSESEKDNDEEKKKKKEEKKERRRRRLDDDDASWDGESSSESDDEIGSDEEAVVIKDKADPFEDIKDMTDLTVEKVVTGKSDNYFDMSLGKFFMDIGLNLVQEFVQNDLLKQQNRKLYREKKGGHSTKATESSIASLMKNLEFSKENNAPYKFEHRKCEFCSFKSESLLALSHHLETPHMKNNVYKCNFCVFESKSPHDILYHMEAEHNSRGRLERAPAYHQCANCPFEDNGKGKLARHLIPCAKKFKPEFNLAPPIEWEPPAKIPKMARARNTMMGSYQSTFHRGQVGSNLGRPHMNNFGACSSFGRGLGPRGRPTMGISPRPTSIQGIPIIRGGVIARQTPTPVAIPASLIGSTEKIGVTAKSTYQPSISITPLPRHPQPVQPQGTQQNKSTCVICEICDGYIKDLEQLRNHMQWIHKVKIHPKMIYNRPPLNCQKCQFRFFTDQGLERHLLGSHGLVTSSMQEAANKGKDAGRCPVCGRVYQWKLLNHVTRDHKLTLKPAHLSYKCTVCTATFGMYKQFENHVYSAHSVVAKRVMDKGKTPTPVKAGQSLLKPLKINDEITIIPQPVKATTPPIKEK